MSNRLTFSLASLIFLIAFGLVFGTTSVMAHENATAGSTTTPRVHSHPLVVTLEAQTATDATPNDLGTEVTPHDRHPTVMSIVAKPDAADATLRTSDGQDVIFLAADGTALDVDTAGAAGTAGTFNLRVTFMGTLVDNGDTTVDDNEGLDADEISFRARRSDGTLVDVSSGVTPTVTAVTGEKNKFDVAIAVASTIYWDSTATPPASILPIEIFVDIGADAVATGTTVNNNGVTLNPASSYAYMSNASTKFTIVSMLSAENARPTATITTTEPADAVTTGSFDIMYTTDDVDMDTVMVAASRTTSPSGALAHYTLDTSTDGTVKVNQAMPDATTMMIPAASVTVTITPSDAGGAGTAVMLTVPFAAKMYEAPNQRPTATISTTAPTAAVTTGSFDIMYTTDDADMDTVTVAATHSASPSSAMTHYTLDTSTDGTVKVNQAMPDATTMMIPAASVTVTITPSDAGGAGTAVMLTVPFAAKTYTPVTDMLAAGGYQVLVGPNFNAGALPGVATVTINNFPDDLAEYLVAGGTINVVATGGDVIINEIMVARDTNKLGALPGDPADGQWIELWNKHGTDAATGISVTFNQSKPASSPDGYADRFTNVAGQGWAFIGKFGEAVLNGSTNSDNPVNFVSIRRTNAGKDGSDQSAWGTAVTSLLFAPGRVGTPGAKNTVDVFTPVPNDRPKLTDTVIISEVANRMDDTKEWIELKGPAGRSLKNWRLNIVTAVGTENTIFAFPNNDNIKISPNGYLLLTDVDPLEGELAADYENGLPAPNRYKNGVVQLGALPNDGNFLLVLRHRADKNGTHEAIEDIAGYAGAAVRRANPYATLWPLRGNAGVISNHNKLEVGKVHHRVRENVHGYSATAGNKLHESAFADIGFTGLGYDRNAPATAENGGTPGYPRGNWKHNGDGAAGEVVISEIMFATGNGGPTRNRNLAQWIEIHNMSDVNSVNLGDWRLEIVNSGENADGTEYAGKFTENISLSGTLPPNQTYLVVARRLGVSQETRLPLERIRNAGKKFTEQLLNPNGFHLTLRANVDRPAGEHKVIDTVGNLNKAPETRRPNAHSFAGNAWELSALGNVVNEDGTRISITRRASAWFEGTDMKGWILTSEDPRYSGIQQLTWFGRNDDHATPGYTIGAALPVSLSTFRPERMKDTGEIVIRWTTESELDNAGFNILRSETKDGEFTKLNTQLIAGQGTTSERTTYEWKDSTAKPNVVYYYQIQDVSIDGNVATLRTVRLKGNVSAVGKATTTWGELKSLQ